MIKEENILWIRKIWLLEKFIKGVKNDKEIFLCFGSGSVVDVF